MTVQRQDHDLGIDLAPGRFWMRDAYLWVPPTPVGDSQDATSRIQGEFRLAGSATRSYYFTSVRGDQLKLEAVKTALWDIGFTPVVSRKDKDRGSKGVDITLAMGMVRHAHQNNYDAAVLVAGDGDYVPLVEEVKRLGKRVHLWFPAGSSLSPKLKLACDHFVDLAAPLRRGWGRHRQ